MPVAFVLINIEPGSEQELLKILRKTEDVEEAHFVYGVYDILVKISAESLEKVKEIVAQRIRRLDKVRSTLTMLVVEAS